MDYVFVRDNIAPEILKFVDLYFRDGTRDMALNHGMRRYFFDYYPPLEVQARVTLAGKLNDALGRVLDAIADPVAQTTIRDEAKALAAEGLASLKEYLRKAGVQNEKTLAEVRKLLAEAEALEAETALRATENQHRQLALLAKQLRLVLAAQQYLERGGVEDLLGVLKDLERA